MKAWEELTIDKGNTICRTNDSQWYVDKGVKIEKFDDGVIEIKNTMTGSDNYEPVTDDQLHVFNTVGWEAGCITVNAYLALRKANRAKHLSDVARLNGKEDTAIKLLESYQKLINKYYDYDIRLNNILSL